MITIYFSGTLMFFLILFLVVPLISPIIDIIYPLNETRSRQQLLRVNYMIFDQNNYFFYVYIQLAWGAVMGVMTIIAVDWLYILIVHHSCGLFAVCGYISRSFGEQIIVLLIVLICMTKFFNRFPNFCYKYRYKVQKATKQIDSDDEIASYKYKVEQFRDCIIMHNEAIEFVFKKY